MVSQSQLRLGLCLIVGLMLSILTYLPSLAQTNSNLSTPSSGSVSSNCSVSGNAISLNGRKFSVPWCQSKEKNSEIHTWLSDTGAMQVFGLDLLNTNNYKAQPINWFFHPDHPDFKLRAEFINPFRYLDVSDLISKVKGDVKVSNKVLNINISPAVISDVLIADYSSSKRIIIDLNEPTFWQLTQAQNQAILTVEATTDSTLLERFQEDSVDVIKEPQDNEELFNNDLNLSYSSLLSLKSETNITKFKINLSKGNRLMVTSLANPYRLMLDIRPEAMAERDILWAPGVSWHQKFITLPDKSKFPVVWLEVDLSNKNVSLRPMNSDSSKAIGVAPLVKTAKAERAIAAINGGYFNRKTQQPLGALRRYGIWLSGPILNRGVIAWNNQGNFKISRLSFEQLLISSNNTRLAIPLLNSGYAQQGLAVYTKEWGPSYKNLTDDEQILVVKNNKISSIVSASKTGENTVPIPSNGYLLIFRGESELPTNLTVGNAVKLEAKVNPTYLADYPFMMGAGPVLLLNGSVVLDVLAEKFNPAFGKQNASRSAIALTRQNKLIIAAVHNRFSGKAATLLELAEIMKALKAVDALNLDGGSSTSLYLGGNLIDRPQETAAKIHNAIGIFLDTKKAG